MGHGRQFLNLICVTHQLVNTKLMVSLPAGPSPGLADGGPKQKRGHYQRRPKMVFAHTSREHQQQTEDWHPNTLTGDVPAYLR